jgi:hypothetical protein
VKNLHLLLVLLAAALPARAQWSFTQTSPPERQYSSIHYDAFPAMVRAPNGNILNFYRDGTSHANDRGVQMLQISTNDGSTWSPFSGANYCLGTDPSGCLFGDTSANGFDSRNGAIGVTSAGTILAFWQTYNYTNGPVGGVPAHTSAQAYFSRSTDSGNTWSPPRALTGYVATYGQLVVVPSGSPGVIGPCRIGCVASILVTDPVGAFVSLVFSYDDGHTWTDPKPISNAISGRTNEVALVWAGGMQLAGVMRSSVAGTTQPFWELQSSDMGSTWTHVTSNIPLMGFPQGSTPVLNTLVSPVAYNPGLPDGSVSLVYAERLTYTQRSVTHNMGWIESITFRPSVVIGSPSTFAGPVQVLATVRSVDSLVGMGYPAIAGTSVDKKVLLEFYQEPTFGANPNLYTMTAVVSRGQTLHFQPRH